MTPHPAPSSQHVSESVLLPLALTEELAEGIVVIDRESRIRYANPAVTRIFGYAREELVGSSLTRLMPEEYRARHAEALGEYLITGRRHRSWMDVELPGLHRDGSELTLRISFTELSREGRRFFCGAIRDVTPDREGEAPGQAAARRHRVLFEQDAAAGLRLDDEGRVLAANSAMAALAGREDGGELEGARLEDLFAAGAERGALREDLRERRDVRNREVEIRRPDGEVRRLLVDGEWVPADGEGTEADGEPARMLAAVLVDVTGRRRIERELDLARQRYRRLFEQQVVAVYRSRPGPGGGVVECNRAFAEMFGYDDPDEVVGTPGHAFYASEEERRAAVERLRREGSLVEHELELRRRDDARIWVLSHERLVRDPEGEEMIEGLYFDVTGQVEAREALERAHAKLEGVFDISPVAQAIVDPSDGRLLEINRAFEEVFGWDRAQARRDAVRGEDLWAEPGRRIAYFDRVERGEMVRNEEVLLRRRDGSTFHGLFSLAALALDEERFVVAAVEDISRLKEVERKLEHRALHDQLTGLPNRSLFWDRLEQSLARSRRTGERIAVLFLDLDGFRHVNDAFGHGAGDEALRQLAGRLRAAVRAEDTAARLGGDEFGMILEGLAAEEEAHRVADRVLREVGAPVSVVGEEARLEASCGMTFYRGSDEEDAPPPEPDALLREADLAMYAAKEEPGSRWREFGPDVESGGSRRLQAEMRLRRGIERGEFAPHYQPIISLEDGRLVAAEALARWQDPERGLVLPSEFIPLAEESGLIVKLGHQLLRQAWRDFARWRHDGLTPPAFHLHLNLSGRQLLDPDLVASIGALLEDDSLDPRELAFEITESAAMGRADVMARLQDLGVRISVDDFGTQYATLDRLTRMDVDSLKVDRSFVERMMDSRRHAAIVEATLALTRALDIAAVAEGIETEAQLARLRELGCDYGQGFLFAAAVPAAEFTSWLEEGRAWPVGG